MTRIERTLYGLFGDPDPTLGDWAEGDDRTDAFPAQPRNTWSNLSYALGGLAVYLTIGGPVALWLLVATIVLTVGSALYHAWPTDDAGAGSFPFSTRQLDHAGMFAVFFAMLGAAFGLSPGLVAGDVLAGAILGLVWPFRTTTPMAFALGGTVALLTLRGERGFPPLGVISLAVFIFSFGAWQLDRLRTWLGDWGHAAWHWGTGLAIALMLAATLTV